MALLDGGLRFYYPDLMVVHAADDHTDQFETTPCLIVEILSASPRAIDEAFKVDDYRRLPSLQGYLLLDSEARGVKFHRRTGQEWQIEVIENALKLPCLDVMLQVEEVYAGVES